MSARNWDTRTADKCRLPDLVPDICDNCRDYAYCHKQLDIFQILERNKQNEHYRKVNEYPS